MSEVYRRALGEMESARAMLQLETVELRQEIERLTTTVAAKSAALEQLGQAIAAFAPVVELGTAFVTPPHSQPATTPVSPLMPDGARLPSIIQATVAVLQEAAGEPVDIDRLA